MSLNIRTTGSNALSILTSDVMNRATSFVLYALVARHLGTEAFGQLSLAFTLFYVFQVFAVGGLKTLVVRQVAKDRSRTSAYFVNGCLIVTLSSCASIGALLGFVRLMHYPSRTALVVLLLSSGLLAYAVSAVCEGIFQAWERMRYIAYVNVPVNAAKIGAAVLLLQANAGLLAVVLVLVSSLAFVAVIESWVVIRRFPSPRASVDVRLAMETMRSAGTFLGIDGTLAVMTSVNVLLLAKLRTDSEVGLYSAATQLTVPLLLVCQSIAQSIFPVLCQEITSGLQHQKRIVVQAIRLLLVVALPAVVALVVAGDQVLEIVYRNPAFAAAFPAVQILAWVLILQVFTSVLGQVLIASNRERATLRIVVVDTLVNGLLGWPVIQRFGLRGAAAVLLCTKAVDCCQHYFLVSRLFGGFQLIGILWKPVVAATAIATYLALGRHRVDAVSGGVSAAFIYGAALLVLAIWTSGGLRRFRERYFPAPSD
ncbi:MAG: hypothetical protein DMF89_10375 [Acidobacteria bacterium]|nr:MAG: hypothetical protein DMF89_10375 [Acidobacteriota bacterium]